MGSKYRIVRNGEVIRRRKEQWVQYQNKSGFELQLYAGKGSKWKTIAKSRKK